MTLPRYTIPDLPSTDELVPYLRSIDTSRWYSNYGPLVSEFEQRLGQHLSQRDLQPQNGAISLTTLASCHQALVIGMRLLNLPERATVLVPCVTFPSSALAVQDAGAEPLFSDIDPDSWSLTPDMARKIAAHRKIDAVMPVAVYGVPVEGWDDFSRETGIPVIIDAAAALDVQPVPAKGLVAYSMHATKPFGIGEGGILASREAGLIDSARMMSNFGTRDHLAQGYGTNAKLSEYHAAVALAQLDRWEQVKQRRRRVFDLYLKALSQHSPIGELQEGIDKAVTSCLMLNIAKPDAAGVVSALNARGVAAHRCYWPPLHHHPHFAYIQKVDALPHAEALNRSIIGLPFHGFMNEADVVSVVRAVAEELSRGLSTLRQA